MMKTDLKKEPENLHKIKEPTSKVSSADLVSFAFL